MKIQDYENLSFCIKKHLTSKKCFNIVGDWSMSYGRGIIKWEIAYKGYVIARNIMGKIAIEETVCNLQGISIYKLKVILKKQLKLLNMECIIQD